MIDASIYQNSNRPSAQLNDPLEAMGKAMTLKQLARKGRKEDIEDEESQFYKAAIKNNMSPDGKLNKEGYISEVFKLNPMKGMELQKSFGELDKQEGEAIKNKVETLSKVIPLVGPGYEYLVGLKTPQERAAAYPQVYESWKQTGLPMNNVPTPDRYNDGWLNGAYSQYANSKDFLEKQKIKSEISANYSKAKDEKLKPLSAEQSEKLAGSDSSLHMVDDLRKVIESNKDSFGPFVGRIASINAYDSRGQEVSAIFKKAAQTIGKALEGGKLTDEDYGKYEKMLPNQKDTVEVAYAKLDQLERMLQSNKNSQIDVYGKAGQNVNNFSQSQVRDISVTKPAPKKDALIDSAHADEGAVKTEKSKYRSSGSVISGDELAQYATKHKIKLSDAEAYLKGQGYEINR